MYLSNLITPAINDILHQYIGKLVSFKDIEGHDFTLICKNLTFHTDDGNCWLEFEDNGNNIWTIEGHGLDIFFEVKDQIKSLNDEIEQI